GEDYKEYLLESAGMLNAKDEVIFTGRREDIPDILQQIDIFVMPSVLEVCSMAILEAMAMGKPVVGLMAGGNPELVTGETGILVGPKDAEGFADAILNLLANAERRRSLGELARKRIEEFFTVKRNVEMMQGAIIECSFRSCGAK
ncbi:MAG: glycosyltransferase family 4 protein, partial [Candidatus Omnitrophota bacterium]|nr:glycosyltransferase family 4 protein [Candidatus Omnitrophota bacterium]